MNGYQPASPMPGSFRQAPPPLTPQAIDAASGGDKSYITTRDRFPIRYKRRMTDEWLAEKDAIQQIRKDSKSVQQRPGVQGQSQSLWQDHASRGQGFDEMSGQQGHRQKGKDNGCCVA